jgi:hypothetical protein
MLGRAVNLSGIPLNLELVPMTSVASPSALDHRALWDQGLTFAEFLAESAPEHLPLWQGVYRTATVPEWARELSVPPGLRLLVLAEDWCGDASNTVPVVARWAEAVGIELRVLRRDEFPEVMDAYLTNGSRSIPIVIGLDADFRVLGHWGPRPAELQAWVMAHRTTLEKDDRYREIRRWYARDRGETTLREVFEAVNGER